MRGLKTISRMLVVLALGSAGWLCAADANPVEALSGPLPIGEGAIVPGAFEPLLWLVGALAPALILWAVLACVRAERTEPTYAQRKARRALTKLVQRLSAANRAPSHDELELWCALTAQLFAVKRAAPTARDLQLHVNALPSLADKSAWLALWSEARAGLYSAQRTVSPDWVTRAAKACGETQIERAASRWPNERHHWLPRAALALLLGAVLAGQDLRAASAEKTAQEKEFLASRELWTTHLRSNPHDWAAQRNVALADQVEELWGPATAHWTAAFVLQPREPSIVAGMQRVVEKMDGIDPTLRRVIAGEWHERAWAELSPGEWQRLVKISAVLLALGLSVGVAGFYGSGKICPPVAIALTVVGVAGFGLGAVGVARYGVLANPQAACITRTSDLRNVPSELVEQEKTTPLLAGQIVTIEGHYFGWSRIKVRSGAEGWVRRAAVLPLYEAQGERGATGYARPDATH
jgi:hypothetical protein